MFPKLLVVMVPGVGEFHYSLREPHLQKLPGALETGADEMSATRWTEDEKRMHTPRSNAITPLRRNPYMTQPLCSAGEGMKPCSRIIIHVASLLTVTSAAKSVGHLQRAW